MHFQGHFSRNFLRRAQLGCENVRTLAFSARNKKGTGQRIHPAGRSKRAQVHPKLSSNGSHRQNRGGQNRSIGQPRARAAAEDGVALEAARRRKEAKYWEFLHSRRCHLVVAAMEVGGRWNEESYDFLVQLAYNKAQTVPAALSAALTVAAPESGELLRKHSTAYTHYSICFCIVSPEA